MKQSIKEMPPGSGTAWQHGCKCPSYDNHHGRGYMGGVKDENGETVFVINHDCPLHGNPTEPKG